MTGKYRHLVQLQTYSNSLDATRDNVSTWSNSGSTFYASLTPQTGTENTTSGNSTYSITTYLMEWRYAPTVRPKDRITYSSRTFNVVSVLNHDERSIEFSATLQEIL